MPAQSQLTLIKMCVCGCVLLGPNKSQPKVILESPESNSDLNARPQPPADDIPHQQEAVICACRPWRKIDLPKFPEQDVIKLSCST